MQMSKSNIGPIKDLILAEISHAISDMPRKRTRGAALLVEISDKFDLLASAIMLV